VIVSHHSARAAQRPASISAGLGTRNAPRATFAIPTHSRCTSLSTMLRTKSFRVEPPRVRRMPLPSPAGAPTPSPASEGGEVLAAGRSRALAAKNRNEPQALERIGVEDALKGTLRRALPALDRVLNAGNTAALGRRARGWWRRSLPVEVWRQKCQSTCMAVRNKRRCLPPYPGISHLDAMSISPPSPPYATGAPVFQPAAVAQHSVPGAARSSHQPPNETVAQYLPAPARSGSPDH
jgi:hypothetical protein